MVAEAGADADAEAEAAVDDCASLVYETGLLRASDVLLKRAKVCLVSPAGVVRGSHEQTCQTRQAQRFRRFDNSRNRHARSTSICISRHPSGSSV